MSMNIKNEAVHRRAQILARLAGESLTQAVDRAVSERLDRLRRARNREALTGRLLKIGQQIARMPRLDTRAADEMLYDERGLPK
jgi:antitoxin VapB